MTSIPGAMEWMDDNVVLEGLLLEATTLLREHQEAHGLAGRHWQLTPTPDEAVAQQWRNRRDDLITKVESVITALNDSSDC